MIEKPVQLDLFSKSSGFLSETGNDLPDNAPKDLHIRDPSQDSSFQDRRNHLNETQRRLGENLYRKSRELATKNIQASNQE